MGKFGESGSFVLTEAEYREVVATMVALRRLGAELEGVFSEFAGAKEAPTRGAAAVVTSTDRVLDILYFRGERG